MISKLKEDRIKMLNELLNKIKEVSQLYKEYSPPFILLQFAWDHTNSLYHLECQTNLDDETLGVNFKDEKFNNKT